MLKVSNVTKFLEKYHYIMVFKNDDLVFDGSVGDLENDILECGIEKFERLEGTDCYIDIS